MGDLSAHFSRREFCCKNGCGLCTPDPHLIQHLERLRAIVGRPLTIRSGLRCPTHNRNVGGAQRSQHLYGRAADIPAGYATVAQARQAGFMGIGRRGNWAVHVDVRKVKRRVEWAY